MTVKQLIEILEKVDPELPIYVWNTLDEVYEEATYADVEEIFLLDCGERIYNEETDEYEMGEVFIISN